MEMTKSGNDPKEQVFSGSCSCCKAEFKAKRWELRVETCPREHYEFAHADCSFCGAKNMVLLYPKKKV